MTSHCETGAHNVFSTIATPSNYLQMLTSQNAGSPHLFVGGRSHYNEPLLNPSIKHCLAHFTAACWAFTANIPDCCKSLHVRLDDYQQSVNFSSSLSITVDSFHVDVSSMLSHSVSNSNKWLFFPKHCTSIFFCAWKKYQAAIQQSICK